ncbi:hypothetical protein (nucleomorph) [Guillardia theta]|uniref:2-(3-amino-3-carboxypropyl)histidine synthase subunit 1 n=1 Tax=Guillardia theta TaxID=55529 RepID=Q98RT5_GUITH|nr:hypothetical protein GTHECHR1071 [Guillardia theta]AAK39863.1 hypothetical protein [Guillardia theta]|mmetsp:Transcript_36519/g.113899  ORF Transcript_36519/g.113899 Transcript_36519/m.113899 type:complete len:415 (+) Transcript_36519:1836-3080(+)
MKKIMDWLKSNITDLLVIYKNFNYELILNNKKISNNNLYLKFNCSLLKKKSYEINRYFPLNYNFENEKIINQFNNFKPKKVLLQLPQGLLEFLPALFSFLFSSSQELKKVFISKIITYGACNIDDEESKLLGICIIIHFGHSCLIKIKRCLVPVIYVFIEINFDDRFFCEKIIKNIGIKYTINIVETIQYRTKAFNLFKNLSFLNNDFKFSKISPLSQGEILGCTTHSGTFIKNFIYLGDGRFHPEGLVLSNPGSKIMQYNPITRQFINFDLKLSEIIFYREKEAYKILSNSKIMGFIKGSMGRQGASFIYRKIEFWIKKFYRGIVKFVFSVIDFFTISLLELSGIDIWVQNSCPRLSIDWGLFFVNPMLTVYEILNMTKIFYKNKKKYPMDFYSEVVNPWSNNYYNKYCRNKI